MSANKRPFDWVGVPSSSSSKRSKAPVSQTTSTNTSPNQVSNFAPTSPSTNAPQPARKTTKPTGYAMLSTLKGSMKILMKGCRACPPLASAVDNLLTALDSIETTKQGSEQLREMASNLYRWPMVLSGYLSESRPKQLSECVSILVAELAEQAEHIKIKTQQKREKIRRLVESGEDVEEIERCYRRIETSFRQLQTDAALSTWKLAEDYLQESRLNAMDPAHDARYNSSFSDRIERRGCFQNTRGSVLAGIRGWIRGASVAKIYWTNGMAGTGKTTIAYSICVELERDGRLGASFFCSRASSACSDVSRILPTIAYQLAQRFDLFRFSLCQILSKNPNTGQCDILMQFEHLIQTPLLEVGDTLPSGLVIVIDALDECAYPTPVATMLDALFRKSTDLPIRFFLTSRPEPTIASTFLNRDNQTSSILHLHNVEEHFVKADIETYLTIALARLSLKEYQIKQLADQAGVLFICAATLARYLLATGIGASTSARLKAILTGSKKGKNMKDREIDLLYKTILDGVLREGRLDEEEVEFIKHVIWTVVCVREPVTIGTLAALLNVDSEQVSAALQPLRSVLHVSEGSEVVSTLHASFPDFMLSSERSGPSLYCNKTMHNEYLASRCFKLMEEQLKFNICSLETSHRFDKDVPDLKDKVKASISLELFYACRYWVEHLRQLSARDELVACLSVFLHERLLFWMEVLNLTGCMDTGPKVLAGAVDWLTPVDGILNTHSLAHDAQKFVATFAQNPVCQSTPHIYISALPLVLRSSKVWESYWGRTRGLLWVDETLKSAPLALWQVRSKSKPPAYSPDGIPAEFDVTHDGIGQRNAHGSTPSGSPFEGHTQGVSSIASSPDGTHMVSGSYDCTIRMWDVRRGTPLRNPFKGHTGWVTSVSFSPDGSRIVSGSWDCTIRVWDAHSGTPLGSPFKGHTDWITSVAFSPSGTRIVSGSYDRTVRVWDVYNGAIIDRPYEGHRGCVRTVSFSPDGTRIVSGSYDCTIRVWDVQSGAMIGSPFEGHTNWVISVAFSPDGTLVVSGSYDRTIRVWDVYSGTPLSGPLEGHTEGVTSVAFSPDGTHIVSGSSDSIIQLWDVHTGTPLGSPFKGHTKSVTSVFFFPNSTRIMSSSWDCTIRVWEGLRAPCPQTTQSSELNVNNSGWLVNSPSQVPVLWLPTQLRDIFPRPPSTLTISPLGPIKPNFTDLMLGTSWAQCYNPLNNHDIQHNKPLYTARMR